MSNRHGSKWIRPEKRKAIYRRDDHACVYCRAGVEDSILTLDHVHPRELGGTNHESNLVTACLTCNSMKRDLTLRQFLRYLRNIGQDTERVARRVRAATQRQLNLEGGNMTPATRALFLQVQESGNWKRYFASVIMNQEELRALQECENSAAACRPISNAAYARVLKGANP